jgi:thioredoxin 1
MFLLGYSKFKMNNKVWWVVALVLVVGGVWYLLGRPEEGGVGEMIPVPSELMVGEEPVSSPLAEGEYVGQVLAGTEAKLLDFQAADYEQALKTDKLIVLYFYANWCPICRAEFPKMEEAFDELTSEQVIGFRVNYNDNQTEEAEKELARQFGVAYQHTKVFIRNGEQLLKAPDSWEKERYLSEIRQKLSQ